MTHSEPLDRAALWARTVDTLTHAVRLTRPGLEGATEPDDFADFLSSALLAVAANVGSVHRLTAGRPGSWEATLVHQLAYGNLAGDDPDFLIAHRTQPVQIPLNVAQLVDDEGPHAEPPILSYDQAAEAIAWPDDDAGMTDDEYEAAEGAALVEYDDLRRRYAEAYADYATRFAAVIDAEARSIRGLILGGVNGPTDDGVHRLRIPVEVVADTDPHAAYGSPFNNPDHWDNDHDPLVWDLWNRARNRLGLPRP